MRKRDIIRIKVKTPKYFTCQVDSYNCDIFLYQFY